MKPTSSQKDQLTTGNTFIHKKEETIEHVNKIIDDYYSLSSSKAGLIHPRFKTLIDVIHNLSRAGGKRMRPYIAVITYEAYGGLEYLDICKAGASLEMIHTAMLIHDDIIDRDFVRYGVPNVAGQYKKIYQDIAGEDIDHFSTSAAILAGDINISASYQLINETNFSPQQKILAQNLLTEAIFTVSGGELIDTEAILYPEEETDPITVSRTKTAHYSFVTPLLFGAVLSEQSNEELDKLKYLGMQLGVAFQLSDDLLGVFGDENITGKSTIGDIREGRRTWMAQNARKLMDDQQQAFVASNYGNKLVTAEQADEIRKIFIECGAKAAAEQKISELANKANELIASLSISEESKALYHDLVKAMTVRNK